jgi:lipid-A-disaccharide synthase
MIIAGEASGDRHAAKLAQAIRHRAPEAFLFGVGGSAMQRAGVRRIVDAESLSVVGITEVAAKLRTIYRAMGTVKKALKSMKPDLLILIDFPDFNFHAAAIAKKIGIPVLYYISPQIWAWRQNRVKKIKRLVDHMAVILPFEAAFYQAHHVPVTFVGHPLLDSIESLPDVPFSAANGDKPVIGLLPGSREKEVATLLPVMLEAAKMVRGSLPSAKFFVSCSESIRPDLVTGIVNQCGSDLDAKIIRGPAVQVFRRSHLLVAASGTVTLEAALYGVPMVIIYKVSPLSYWLGKRLIKVEHIGIVNLIVQKRLLPELIQETASPHTIAETVTDLINDSEKLAQIQRELCGVKDLLGGVGASERVAEIALDLIKQPLNDPPPVDRSPGG